MLRPLKTPIFKSFSPSFLAAAAVLLLAACASAKSTEFSSTISELDRLPRVRPDFRCRPTRTSCSISNARLVPTRSSIRHGHLTPPVRSIAHTPLTFFGGNFTSGGIRVPLTFLERMFVYGVDVRPAAPGTDAITANVVSYPKRPMTVDLDREGRPRASIQIGGRQAKLAYVYVEIDETKTIPSIIHVDLFGLDVANGRVLHELFKPQRSQN